MDASSSATEFDLTKASTEDIWDFLGTREKCTLPEGVAGLFTTKTPKHQLAQWRKDIDEEFPFFDNLPTISQTVRNHTVEPYLRKQQGSLLHTARLSSHALLALHKGDTRRSASALLALLRLTAEKFQSLEQERKELVLAKVGIKPDSSETLLTKDEAKAADKAAKKLPVRRAFSGGYQFGQRQQTFGQQTTQQAQPQPLQQTTWRGRAFTPRGRGRSRGRGFNNSN